MRLRRCRVAPPPARPRARTLDQSLPDIFAFVQHNTDGTIWRCRARYPHDGQVRLERTGQPAIFPFASELQHEWTVL